MSEPKSSMESKVAADKGFQPGMSLSSVNEITQGIKILNTMEPWDSKKACEELSKLAQLNKKISELEYFELLHCIALHQDQAAFSILADFHKDIIDAKNNKGLTVLDYLAKKNKIDLYFKAVTFLFNNCAIPSGIKDDNSHVIDENGNTVLHYIAYCGDMEAYEFFMKTENCTYAYLLAKNSQEKTASDVALQNGHLIISTKLYWEEFSAGHFKYYLANFLKKQKKYISDQATVEIYRKKMLDEIMRLSHTIVIPASELDEKVVAILKKLKIEFNAKVQGYELPLPDDAVKKMDEKTVASVYKLTCISKIEKTLTKSLLKKLKEYIKDDDGMLAEREAKYDAEYNEAWDNYDEKIANFEDGDDGYDYGGPIRPKQPTIRPFNKKQVKVEIRNEFSDVFNDLKGLVEGLEYSDEDFNAMLSEHFRDQDLMDDIIDQIDFNELGLKEEVGAAILKNMKWSFPEELDINEPGFLVKIFVCSLNMQFQELFYDFEVFDLAKIIIENLSAEEHFVKMMRDYERSSRVGASSLQEVDRQKIWIIIQKQIESIINKTNEPAKKKRKTLDKKPECEQVRLENESGTECLIKVFPTDQSCRLLYGERSLPLKPIFKSLYSIARGTHELIAQKKNKSSKKSNAQSSVKTEKTNIVTAMLSFVVSTSDFSKREVIEFINIPLTLKYADILLSLDPKDGVFKDADEFGASVAFDREQGGRIVGKLPKTNIESTSEKALGVMTGIIDAYNIDSKQKKELLDMLKQASVDKPLALEYRMAKDIHKATGFHHSERIILHALKQPENVKMIIDTLREKIKGSLRLIFGNKYVLQAGALILYSYPNSVCEECGLGLIALQDSFTQGFIKEFTSQINVKDSTLAIDMVSTKTNQLVPKFKLSVVVGARNVFSDDPSGNLVKGKPALKLDLQHNGINLKTDPFKQSRFFYEFVESSVHESEYFVPFSGLIAMSGSKDSKFSKKDKESLPKELKTMMEEHNTSSDFGNILSFSKGHKPAAGSGSGSGSQTVTNTGSKKRPRDGEESREERKAQPGS